MDTPTHTESQLQLQRVARGGALNFAGAIVAAVSGFALVAIVARSFSPETAGVLFASTSVFLVVLSLAVFGSDTGLARFLLRFEETERTGDIRTVLRCARRGVLFSSLALAAVVFVLADPAADVLGLDHPQSPAVLRILAITIPFAALAQLAMSETRAIGRMRPTVVIDNVVRTTGQTVAVAIVAVSGGGLFALTAGWAIPYVGAALLALPTARWYLRRRSTRWSNTSPTSDPASVRREFRRFSWPRGVARVSQIVVQRADVVVIAATLGAAPAAVYTAATRFVVVGQMSSGAISNVLMPRMAQLLARRDMATVSDVFKISTAWSMAVAWPLYAVIAASSGLYLQIFGEGYAGASGAPVVITMSLAMMIATAAGALDTVLLMSGRSVASLVNGCVAASLNVVLCVVLIPWIGIVGAAIAWAVAVLTRNALAFVLVRRDLGITPLSSGALFVASAVFACYAAPFVALSLFDALSVVTFAVTLAAVTAAYLFLLWRARERLALAAFRSVLPRRMAKRLRAEA